MQREEYSTFLMAYIITAIAHIKNRTYNPIVNKTPYEVLIGNAPNIGYLKTLGSLTYTLIPKEKRTKLEERANKGILVGFESSNNFLVYIPTLNEVISTKDLTIKEDLYYNKEYITIEDNYNNLLEFNTYEDDYFSSNIEENTELEGDSLDELNSEYYNNNNPSLQEPSIQEPSIQEHTLGSTEHRLSPRDTLSPRDSLSPIEDLDELSLDYYNNLPRRSPRIRGDTPSSQGLQVDNLEHSIYKLASYAYYTTLNEESKEDNSSNKIILPKSLNIKEPKDYNEAYNSKYKEY
jgi:hypothetical protein